MSRLIVITALVFLILGPLGAFVGVLPPVIGFAIHALGGAVALVAAVWAGIAWARRRQRRELITIVLALPALAAIAMTVVGVASHPRINDITSDLADPPALADTPEYPESFKAIVSGSYPDVKTQVVARPAADVFAAVVAIAESRDRWSITLEDSEAGIVQGVATTAVFRFQDDFTIRVRAVDGDPARAAIDMRSRSRDGKSDLGVNARRIREFFAEFH